ncbi:MAG: SBBP repeat-containing protein [Chloroflexota bacterium]
MSLKKSNRSKRPLFFLFLLLGIGTIWLYSQYDAEAGGTDPTDIDLSTFFGGSGNECEFGRCSIAIDDDGSIIVAGSTPSTDIPLQNPLFIDSDAGSTADIFVMKLTPDGSSLVFSTYIGNGTAQGMKLDDDGNIYVVGYSSDDNFPTTSDAYANCVGNGIDAVFFKLNSTGTSLEYSSCIGGAGRDEAHDIAINSQGQMIIVGDTLSTDFPLQSPYQNTAGDDEDIFLAKLSTNGSSSSLLFSTYFGGDSRDYGWGLEVDDADNIYIGGRSSSDDFPTTAGVIQSERLSNAGTDSIVAKFSNAGNLLYSTFYNTVSTSEAADIAVDDNGNLYFVTTWEEAIKLNPTATEILYFVDLDDFFVPVEGKAQIALDDENNLYILGQDTSSQSNLVLTAVHHTGRAVFSRTIGGSDMEDSMGLALRQNNDEVTAYLLGVSKSTDFPTINALYPTLAGGFDIVITNVTGLETAVQFNEIYLPLMIR